MLQNNQKLNPSDDQLRNRKILKVKSVILPVQRKIDWESLTMDQILGKEYESPSELLGNYRISLKKGCNEACYFCHNDDQEEVKVSNDEDFIQPNILWPTIIASLELGKKRINFTGGEPGLDKNIVDKVRGVKTISPEAIVGMTTNATLLADNAQELANAGLDKITVSLHALTRENYKKVTSRDLLYDALAGLEAAKKAGIYPIKINMVVGRSYLNEVPLVEEYARENGFELRLLDILPINYKLQRQRVSQKELHELFPDIIVKGKYYHEKCGNCDYTQICGEGDYVRLSTDGILGPCMFRPDLKIQITGDETPDIVIKKVALAYRRVQFDNL